MAKDRREIINQNGPMGFVLCVAWVGALVYFVNHAHGFWEVVLAFLQACVWPAFVLYHALEALAV